MGVKLTNETAEQLFRTMVKIRCFEEKVIRLYADGEIPGFMHIYVGEEAVAAGVCAALTREDYITSTHRGHGHCIAKGGRLDLMMAELFGRRTGYCKGKGGSMHIADFDIGILGANGIVGGGLPIAAGTGAGIKYKGEDKVCVCFFGDGATNIGPFHEACNLAATWELPVIFVCENNQFAQTTPQSEHQRIKDVANRALAYDMPAATVDGNDVLQVYQAARTAVEAARRGKGPTFLECKTYRWRGHWEGDPQPYRTPEDVARWKEKCPIARLRAHLVDNKVSTVAALEQIENDVRLDLEAAVEFARKSPLPDAREAYDDIYTIA